MPSYRCPGTSHNIIKTSNILCPNLMQTRENATSDLYPLTSGPQKCTIILLENLAQPDWVNIDCHDQLLPGFLCMSPKDDINMTETGVQQQICIFCSPNVLYFKQKCFVFEWINNLTSNNQKLQKEKKVQGLEQLWELSEVFTATRCPQPPLLTTNNTALQCVQHPDHSYCEVFIPKEDVSGYMVYLDTYKPAPVGDNYFRCVKGSSVHLESICDGSFDCPNDKSDETNCNCIENSTTQFLEHCKFLVSKNKVICGPLYYKTSSGNCILFANKYQKQISFENFNHVSCVNQFDISLQNDLVVDCNISEENHLINVLKGQLSFCKHQMEFPCLEGHSKCFNISHICLYSLTNYGLLFPCRNGGHMETCQFFSCNKHFKCVNSYCIKWTYVCDTKWDCPSGDDEYFLPICGNKSMLCVNMFKCWGQQICVSLISVCDNTLDCPAQDDEQFCELTSFTCPFDCHCRALAVICVGYHIPQSECPFLFITVKLTPKIQQTVSFFTQVLFLTIQNCNVTKIADLGLSETLIFLNMAANSIECVPEQSFQKIEIYKYCLWTETKFLTLMKRPFLS